MLVTRTHTKNPSIQYFSYLLRSPSRLFHFFFFRTKYIAYFFHIKFFGAYENYRLQIWESEPSSNVFFCIFKMVLWPLLDWALNYINSYFLGKLHVLQISEIKHFLSNWYIHTLTYSHHTQTRIWVNKRKQKCAWSCNTGEIALQQDI